MTTDHPLPGTAAPSRGFRAAILLLIGLALILRLPTVGFSLPYIDHPDEPNYYLAGQEMRGLYDSRGYWENSPPAYIWLSTAVQVVTEPLGALGMAAQVRLLRLLAAALNVTTLLLIALTARRAAGDWAGVIAGLSWAISPLVLLNGVYALPDPPVYAVAALALWLAGEALAAPGRGHWSVWSVAVGVLGVAFKAYLPALAPGVLAALILTRRGWRTEGARSLRRLRSLRYLGWQALIIALTGLWVVFGIGFAPVGEIGPANGGANSLLREIQENGLGRLFNLGTVVNNLRFALRPLGEAPTLWALGLGAAAWAAGRFFLRRERGAPRLDTLLMIAAYGVIAAWVVAAYSRVTLSQIRYMIPVTVGVCVLVGAAFAQGVALFSTRWRALAGIGLLALYGAAIGLPQLQQDIAIVQDRSRTDRRADVRFWAETTLDPGPVLLTADNHKTFNHVWSGIPVAKWFDWIETDDPTAHPAAHWREERGVEYALLTAGDQERLQATPQGRAFLAEMMLLRDFPARADRRGPGMALYRLWPPQVAAEVRFGPALHLRGYDLENPAPAPGEPLTLRFYWQAETPPQGDYSLFVHLAPPDDRSPAAQWDGPPARLERPTPSWDAPSETLISQSVTLSLPPELPPGEYRVLIGLYDYQTGARLPVTVDGAVGQVLPDDTLHLLTITLK